MMWALFFTVFLFFQIGFLGAVDYNSICAHLNQRFECAEVYTEPFPHVIIKNIFPDEYYEELCRDWPISAFDRQPFQWRKLIEVGNQEKWEGFEKEQKKWEQFAYIVDEVIKKKLAAIFYPLMHLRFGYSPQEKVLCNAASQSEHRLFQDYAHGVGVHIDRAYKLAAVMIFFPVNYRKEHEELGTIFYQHKQNKESIDLAIAGWDEVRQVKRTSFLPNTLCAFFQTPFAWHSAPLNESYHRLRSSLQARRSYFTNIYLTPTFMKEFYGTTFGLEDSFFCQDDAY